MKLAFWSVGKTHDAYVKQGIEEFTKRVGRYYPVEWQLLPVPRNAASMPLAVQKKKEGEIILDLLRPDDQLIALDEHGKQLHSPALAEMLQRKASESARSLVFLIGGAFGLDDAVLKQAKFVWSLSNLTFPHQLVRLILAEQVYRACTIIQNEKYHHQ